MASLRAEAAPIHSAPVGAGDVCVDSAQMESTNEDTDASTWSSESSSGSESSYDEQALVNRHRRGSAPAQRVDGSAGWRGPPVAPDGAGGVLPGGLAARCRESLPAPAKFRGDGTGSRRLSLKSPEEDYEDTPPMRMPSALAEDRTDARARGRFNADNFVSDPSTSQSESPTMHKGSRSLRRASTMASTMARECYSLSPTRRTSQARVFDREALAQRRMLRRGNTCMFASEELAETFIFLPEQQEQAIGGSSVDFSSRLLSEQSIRDIRQAACREVAVTIQHVLAEHEPASDASLAQVKRALEDQLETRQLRIAKEAFDLSQNDMEELKQVVQQRWVLEASMSTMPDEYLKEISKVSRDRQSEDLMDAVRRVCDDPGSQTASDAPKAGIVGTEVQFFEPLLYLTDEMRALFIDDMHGRLQECFKRNPALREKANVKEFALFDTAVLRSQVEKFENQNRKLREEIRALNAKIGKVDHSFRQHRMKLLHTKDELVALNKALALRDADLEGVRESVQGMKTDRNKLQEVQRKVLLQVRYGKQLLGKMRSQAAKTAAQISSGQVADDEGAEREVLEDEAPLLGEQGLAEERRGGIRGDAMPSKGSTDSSSSEAAAAAAGFLAHMTEAAVAEPGAPQTFRCFAACGTQTDPLEDPSSESSSPAEPSSPAKTFDITTAKESTLKRFSNREATAAIQKQIDLVQQELDTLQATAQTKDANMTPLRKSLESGLLNPEISFEELAGLDKRQMAKLQAAMGVAGGGEEEFDEDRVLEGEELENLLAELKDFYGVSQEATEERDILNARCADAEVTELQSTQDALDVARQQLDHVAGLQSMLESFREQLEQSEHQLGALGPEEEDPSALRQELHQKTAARFQAQRRLVEAKASMTMEESRGKSLSNCLGMCTDNSELVGEAGLDAGGVGGASGRKSGRSVAADRRAKLEERLFVNKEQIAAIVKENANVHRSLAEFQMQVSDMTVQLREALPNSKAGGQDLDSVMRRMERVTAKGGAAYIRMFKQAQLREIAVEAKKRLRDMVQGQKEMERRERKEQELREQEDRELEDADCEGAEDGSQSPGRRKKTSTVTYINFDPWNTPGGRGFALDARGSSHADSILSAREARRPTTTTQLANVRARHLDGEVDSPRQAQMPSMGAGLTRQAALEQRAQAPTRPMERMFQGSELLDDSPLLTIDGTQAMQVGRHRIPLLSEPGPVGVQRQRPTASLQPLSMGLFGVPLSEQRVSFNREERRLNSLNATPQPSTVLESGFLVSSRASTLESLQTGAMSSASGSTRQPRVLVTGGEPSSTPPQSSPATFGGLAISGLGTRTANAGAPGLRPTVVQATTSSRKGRRTATVHSLPEAEEDMLVTARNPSSPLCPNKTPRKLPNLASMAGAVIGAEECSL